MTVTLDRLAAVAGGRVDPAEAGGAEVAGIAINAADVPAGGIFAAVPGTRAHGAAYAGQSAGAAVLTDARGLAILRGAGVGAPVVVVDEVRPVLGAVAAEVYGRPSAGLTMIGVTGTSGKTTTTYLLEGALMAAGARVGLIGTTGTRIDGAAVPSHLTTPEAPELQRLLRRMADAGVTHVVMEVSSHALALGRVAGLDFDVTAFLNLSQDHLDFHGSLEEYFAAKAALFDPGSALHAPHAVICVDDAWGRRMAALAAGDAGARVTAVVTAGAGDPAAAAEAADAARGGAWRAARPRIAANGVQHTTVTGPEGQSAELDVAMPGAFNIANATVAWAILAALGRDGADAARGLGAVGVPGRMERVDAGQDFLAVVDYAHKPAALAAVLATLRAQTAGRLIAVIGCGGDRDAGKRPLMGAAAAEAADAVIVTDDNPRGEDPASIREAILDGARGAAARRDPAPEVREIADRAAAIAAAVAAAAPGDAILVAGKGHETGQDVGGVVHPFDDRVELRRALDAAPATGAGR